MGEKQNQLVFDAEIEAGARGGAGVSIPVDVKAVFGTGGRVPVQATFDGHPHRGSLAPMGGGKHMLGVTKTIRAAIGKDVGDRVQVRLRPDTEPRVVEVPQDLQAALDGRPDLLTTFQGMSYTHRKEFVRWVEEAKKEATRERRIHRTLEMLGSGDRL